MTGVETSADLLEFLQADHAGKITSEEMFTQWRMIRTQHPALIDSLRFFPISPFKTGRGQAESSELVSGQIHLLLRLLAFLIKAYFLSIHTCLSNDWLLSN